MELHLIMYVSETSQMYGAIVFNFWSFKAITSGNITKINTVFLPLMHILASGRFFLGLWALHIQLNKKWPYVQ